MEGKNGGGEEKRKKGTKIISAILRRGKKKNNSISIVSWGRKQAVVGSREWKIDRVEKMMSPFFSSSRIRELFFSSFRTYAKYETTCYRAAITSNARIKFFIRGCINPEADEADGHVDRFAFLVAVYLVIYLAPVAFPECLSSP